MIKRKGTVMIIMPSVMFILLMTTILIQGMFVDQKLHNLRVERLQESLDSSTIKSVLRSRIDFEYNGRDIDLTPSDEELRNSLALDLIEYGIIEDVPELEVELQGGLPSKITVRNQDFIISNFDLNFDDDNPLIQYVLTDSITIIGE